MWPRWPSAETAASNLEKGALAAGDFATSAPVGSTVETLAELSLSDGKTWTDTKNELSQTADRRLAALERRFGQNPDPRLRASLDETRTKINAEIAELKARADRATAQGTFLSRLGKALDILDFVSIAAQGAGYLVEGDRVGAAGVVANELAKKSSEGLGSLATSFAPGGPVYGSWAGSEL